MNVDRAIFLLYDTPAVRALNVLSYIFKADAQPITINGKCIDLGDIFMYSKVEGKAREIGPLVFYGGPPDNIASHRGTLLTILVDWILAAYVKNHYKLISQLEKANLDLDFITPWCIIDYDAKNRSTATNV
jgi:hypothetical protein